MHIAVWIITPITTPWELGIAFQKAKELAGPFGEERWRNSTEDPDKQILPPVSWDWVETGGRWDGEIRLEGELNHATGKEAAMVPDRNMPLAVIAPNGYLTCRAWEEEPEEFRRILLNWPDNLVVAQDWHC